MLTMPSTAAGRGYALGWSVVLLAVVVNAAPVSAAINLSLSPASRTVHVGDTVNLGLMATSDSASSQLLAATQAIVMWNPALLHLNGLSQTGAAPLLFAGFGPDSSGLNEASPPADGDALFQCGALLGQRVAATPAGTRLTTLQFTALAPSPAAVVGVPATLMGPTGPAMTIVFDGVIPAFSVTGTLTGATIEILPACGPPGDLNCNGVVDSIDLGILLANWSIPARAPGCGGAMPCAADLNSDGHVDSLDLGILLIHWTL